MIHVSGITSDHITSKLAHWILSFSVNLFQTDSQYLNYWNNKAPFRLKNKKYIHSFFWSCNRRQASSSASWVLGVSWRKCCGLTDDSQRRPNVVDGLFCRFCRDTSQKEFEKWWFMWFTLVLTFGLLTVNMLKDTAKGETGLIFPTSLEKRTVMT